jgi:hypothetical protein
MQTRNGAIDTPLRILGLLIAVVLPFEALCLWMSFSEAVDDGMPLSGHTLFSSTLLALAPFGLTAFVVPLLCGCLYWQVTRKDGPSALSLITGVSLAAMGWAACAASAEVFLQYALMDGGREPTISMWLANLGLIFTITGAIVYTWRRDGKD